MLVSLIDEKKKAAGENTVKFQIFCYNLGKEEVFHNLAEHFNTKI